MSHPIVVVDTNKVLAAVLRPGRARRLLFSLPALLVAPPHAWREAEKHIAKLAGRRGLSPGQLTELLEEMRKELIVELEPGSEESQRAQVLAAGFDPDDWPFIALALQLDAIIWTNDRGIIRNSLKTRRYRAADTEALEALMAGESWNSLEKLLEEKYLEPRKRRTRKTDVPEHESQEPNHY